MIDTIRAKDALTEGADPMDMLMASAATGATGPTSTTGPGGSSGVTASTEWTGPVLVGYTTFSDAAPAALGTDIICAVPSGTTEGDLLLLFIAADHPFDNESGDQAMFDAAGWTLFLREMYGEDTQGSYLAYRIQGANGPTSFLFNDVNTGQVGVQALLRAYRNVDPDAPIEGLETYIKATGETGVSQVSTPTPSSGTQSKNALAVVGLAPDQAIDGPIVTRWPAPFDDNRLSVSALNTPYAWASLYSAEARLPQPVALAASAFEWLLQNSSYYTGVLTFVLVLKARGTP